MGSINLYHLCPYSSTTFPIASSSSGSTRIAHPKHIHSHQIIKFTQMAKQKIVVKVIMTSNKKTRKALQIAVSLSGVESAAFVGSDKDQIAVTGEGIDSVELASLLRKGVGHTELVSVGPVEEKKAEEKKKNETVKVEVNPPQYCNSYYGNPWPYYYHYVYKM